MTPLSKRVRGRFSRRWRDYSALLLCCLLAAGAFASDCSRTSVNLLPLDELGTGLYQGFAGGLYPGGVSRRPDAHTLAGLEQARSVVPRDAAGNPDAANGRIVFLSGGMSNATQEFSFFKNVADRDPRKNPQVVIVDGAQGGQTAERIATNPEPYWTEVSRRLAAAGVTAAQVQTAWMKEADASPSQRFPEHARRLQSEMLTVAQQMRTRFPNLRLLYLSSRIYAGYASTNLNPEPFAYESGFAVKWLIEQQINGDVEASFGNLPGGRVPWMSWGPYLWADGLRARSDGLTYACADLQDDGTHPNTGARTKVTQLLLDFLKTDITARAWFLRAGTPAPPSPAIGAVVNSATYLAPVAPRAIVSIFGTDLAASTQSVATLPLPSVVGATAVDVDGMPCALLYVSAQQINCVLPAAVAFSPANVTVAVWRDTVRSVPALLNLRPLGAGAPGVFTLDSQPTGPAAALHADGSIVGVLNPARPGETIMLFLTGLGLLDAASRARATPVVRIAGADATVTYAGQAPGFAGLDQINVTIPLTTPPPSARVEVVMGGATSNAVTVAIR